MRRKAVGRLGEDMATQMLQRNGYQLVERNWHHRTGEIDIIAREGDCWVFVEVKTRHGHRVSFPEDGLTDKKARRLQQLAMYYLDAHDIANATWRIDLVAIELDRDNQPIRVNHIPSAALI